MLEKFKILAGQVAGIICLISYFLFSSLNKDYKHLTNAFSELSSVGQPNNLGFSIFGFLIPGLLISWFFLGQTKSLIEEKAKSYPLVLIGLSGLLIAIGASPMNFEDFSSLSSTLHIVGVMGSGLLFITGAFTLAPQLRKHPEWKKLRIFLISLTWLFVIAGFFRESNLPGLAQKIGILIYYLYIGTLSYKAYQLKYCS